MTTLRARMDRRREYFRYVPALKHDVILDTDLMRSNFIISPPYMPCIFADDLLIQWVMINVRNALADAEEGVIKWHLTARTTLKSPNVRGGETWKGLCARNNTLGSRVYMTFVHSRSMTLASTLQREQTIRYTPSMHLLDDSTKRRIGAWGL